ncbi:MAG TPA: twin-arginine translocase TatA/TatE family subunit [Candidatus Nitrosotenuis sp.]|jgi:sec-independent protein translocase protein TatA|nr:twin-arginine translocase TatA/TatE family subunit [Candidatus Nitrosotenuis sp.]HIH45810.1 twin-arginine translocase TatA/TatE family subunit [Candidatus Nitrosotenuis sp.]HIH68921.1 twin-arginine translocase TatA/TatE family subunit [Candidatus Nitrosotenuis sp.]HII03344.1 twin-arginine translocase TatA/TatE family subunit [Candidatus Nitrosotenuis sp.]
MFEYSLNILGSEWIIIVFVALIALLGTNRFPDVAKKLGRAVGQYNKTKEELQNQLAGITNTNLNITNPVQNERQKMEFIAKSLGIDFLGKTDDELKKLISDKMSGSNTTKEN